jgi:hypothetical protein
MALWNHKLISKATVYAVKLRTPPLPIPLHFTRKKGAPKNSFGKKFLYKTDRFCLLFGRVFTSLTKNQGHEHQNTRDAVKSPSSPRQALPTGVLARQRFQHNSARSRQTSQLHRQSHARNVIPQYETHVLFGPGPSEIEAKSRCFADCAQPVV